MGGRLDERNWSGSLQRAGDQHIKKRGPDDRQYRHDLQSRRVQRHDRARPEHGTERPDFSSQSLDRVGFHIQAGSLIAGRVYPAFRYARTEALEDSGDVSQEVAVAVSVLAYGHHVKWVTDVTALTEERLAPEATDFQVRSQIQVNF